LSDRQVIKKQHGLFERFLEVFDGAKEMVAVASNYRSSVSGGFNCYRRWLGGGAICLYPVLMADKKLTREKEIETILTICVALVVIFLISKQHHKYWLTISVLLGLVGMFSKYLTSKIAWAWMKLSEGMGAVTSKIILSAIFFTFLFPIAMLSRLFKNDSSLKLKKPAGNSFYFTRNHKFEAKDLENTW
jgi:saxitoxin biosynthesis operon SxtJ-like protein